MFKQIIAAVVALAPLITLGQKKFANTINADDLRRHLAVVASAEMMGRETASEGERKAAAYIEQHFKSLGLKPGNGDSFRQPFPVYRTSISQANFKVDDKRLELGRDFSVLRDNYDAKHYFGEAVYVPDSVPDSVMRLAIRGKLLIASSEKATRALYEQEPAAVILIQDSLPPNEPGLLNNSIYRWNYMSNGYIITTAAAKQLFPEKMDSTKPYTVRRRFALQHETTIDTLTSANVIGIIEGTNKKEEYLFITAHYDHIGVTEDSLINFGADDDGSGTCAILEMAEAFSKAKAAGNGPRRTIVFMTVSGEEKGLWGSAYYASHPIFPLNQTTADLNIDMIGRIDPGYKGNSKNYIYAIGENKLSSELTGITDAINKRCCKLQIDRKFNDPKDPNQFYYRSDHYNFAKKGVPIIFYFNGVHADYHQPTDTPDKINYNLLAKRTKLIFYTAWEMANRNGLIKRDLPIQ